MHNNQTPKLEVEAFGIAATLLPLCRKHSHWPLGWCWGRNPIPAHHGLHTHTEEG